MKVVVIGGTGLIGSKLVAKLREQGQEAVAASPASGVDVLTGAGLARALDGASVVVDVSNSPAFDGEVAMKFFSTATPNLLAAEASAGARLHVALSVVGTERLLTMGYFRAKLEQELLIQQSFVPYSIVRATQFFEFGKQIAAAASEGDTVRLPPVLFQPMAADDIASALATFAAGAPLNRTAEIAGPAPLRLDTFVQRALEAARDRRNVVTDPAAGYFGVPVSERTLLPAAGAHLGDTSFERWLTQQNP